MKFFFITLLILILANTKAYSDIAKKIMYTLAKSNNYEFKFTQKINKKKETGNCVLLFNRKINCKYDNSGKILISDGKNLIIKNENSNIPNFYKLDNTAFYKILDKNYLISELEKSNIKDKNGELFVNLNYQDIGIKIFFDKEKLLLKGWQTTDMYNNSVFTEIKILEVNKIIDEDLFDIKKFN
tara:strand:- start:2270 stop:2821 length:552 start_codon:yes stop_codon:yes gene_type:complete